MEQERNDPGAWAPHLRPDSNEEVVLRGGDRVLIRPMQHADKELERRFIRDLSETSRRFRFLETIRAPSDALLEQLTARHSETDAAFVAVIGESSHEQAVGVGRLSADPGGDDCEFALTVSDAWQEKGLASHLMRRLLAAASARGISRMHSSDAADNDRMRDFAAHARLRHQTDPDDARLVRYSIEVQANPAHFIDLTQTHEVSGWCHALACTENELKAAIATVGNATERVREYLSGRRSPSR